MNFEYYVLENNLGTIENNYTFKELTTIGCGGHIKILYKPNSVMALQKAFKFINENELQYFILGNGSNVLAMDNDYEGIVISLRGMPYQLDIKEQVLDCSAFYPTIKLAYELARLGFGDLAFLGGIPGLLGGAIYNNSGAYKKEIKDCLIDVTYINSAGELRTITNPECNFGYRHSIFHHLNGLIISARFHIEPMETLELLDKRCKERKLTQPLECKSMGSIFKNNQLISAWKVIDALGMRGFQINDAAVSAKHANFIINLGQAKSADILRLIELLKKRAENEFGIKLHFEITIV